MKTYIHFSSYLAHFFFEWELFQNKVVENTHFVFRGFFFLNCGVYEIMWKNNVELGRPQTTIWRMRVTFSMPKATNTRRIWNNGIIIVFPPQQWLHKRGWLLRYAYIAFISPVSSSHPSRPTLLPNIHTKKLNKQPAEYFASWNLHSWPINSLPFTNLEVLPPLYKTALLSRAKSTHSAHSDALQ